MGTRSSPPGTGDVADPDLLAVLEDELAVAQTAADVEQLVRRLDALRVRTEAALAIALARAEELGVHRLDGHSSIAGWARAELNWSTAESWRLARTGRMLRRMPLVAQAAHDGRVRTPQLTVLGVAHANTRACERMPEFDELLATHGAHLRYPDFARLVGRWVALADPDGAARRHDRVDEDRHAAVRTVGEATSLVAAGTALAGAELREILLRFVEVELATDWAEARARLGDEACTSTLARTDRQRRFDALVAIFRAAAGSGAIPVTDPLVNILLDARTAADTLVRATGGEVPVPSPDEVLARRCETVDGVQVDPRDALAAMLLGQLRRVVLDAESVVIDLGRRGRLFRGGARDAVLLPTDRCAWPGCIVPGPHSEIDHLLEWERGGRTRPCNGVPKCGRHHRFGHRHRYTTRREADGTWRTFRPDGTEVGRLPRTT